MGEKVFLFLLLQTKKLEKIQEHQVLPPAWGCGGFSSYIHNKHYPLVLYCANTSVVMYSADCVIRPMFDIYITIIAEQRCFVAVVFRKHALFFVNIL